MPRYIDADALYDRFQNLSYDDWNQGTGTTWANAFAEAADVVDDMPTEDVAPIRHGRWEPIDVDRDEFHCSLCVCRIKWGTVTSAKYCPMCGAKMDASS